MNRAPKLPLTDYNDTSFPSLNFDNESIVGKSFEDCVFTKSSFSKSTLTACKFIGCSFVGCNLSSIELDQSSFRDVLFEDSKIIGVNWTKAKQSRVKLAKMLHFRNSNVSYSSFMGLSLRGLIFEKCQVHEVDFREADLTGSDFTLSDLKGSLFTRTQLCGANFIDAINYNINPLENDIQKGKFSLPDAITLLACFDIHIE